MSRSLRRRSILPAMTPRETALLNARLAARRWWTIEVAPGAVRRPPGVRLDSGGLAKGLFADLLAERLAGHAAFAIDCAGDLRLGGAECKPRAVDVRSPFGEDIL